MATNTIFPHCLVLMCRLLNGQLASPLWVNCACIELGIYKDIGHLLFFSCVVLIWLLRIVIYFPGISKAPNTLNSRTDTLSGHSDSAGVLTFPQKPFHTQYISVFHIIPVCFPRESTHNPQVRTTLWLPHYDPIHGSSSAFTICSILIWLLFFWNCYWGFPSFSQLSI